MSGTTLRRVMKELKDLQKNPIKEFTLHTVEDSALVLHFTMMGPLDSPYQEGIYHGRILIPSEYPFAPPDVVMLTPSGRFEVGKKVCLSVSSYHPERWKATWGIATVIHALRDHMATSEKLGIGAVDYPNIIRVKMAGQSRDFVCKECGAVVASVWENVMKDAPPATDVDVAAKMELLASPAHSPQSTPSSSAAATGMGGMTPSGWEMLPAAATTAEPTTTTTTVSTDATNTTTTTSGVEPALSDTTSTPATNVASSSLDGRDTAGDTYPTDEVVNNQLSSSPSTTAATASSAAARPANLGGEEADSTTPTTTTMTDADENTEVDDTKHLMNDDDNDLGAAAEELAAEVAAAQQQPPVVVPAGAHDRHMRVERRGRRVQVHLSISMIDAWIYRLVALVAVILLKKVLLDHWTETARVGGVVWDVVNAW